MRFAPELPTLSPHMLLPRGRSSSAPFPFDHPHAQYFYVARNGIYALAQLWKLADQEVLFPAYFHGVELEALLAAGVRLRYYPVRERMRIEANDVRARIGPETRAIYLTHYLGFPGPVEELAAVCGERDLLLIEDCALALLSRLGERPLGSFGDAAIFCLHKTLPVPNGGALVMRSNDFSAPFALYRPRLLSTLARAAHLMNCYFKLQGNTIGVSLLRKLQTLGKRVAHGASKEVGIGSDLFDRSQVGLAMSRLSQFVIAAQDFSAIVERRRRSYLQLLNRLRHLSPVFDDLPPGVCPLLFPFQAENGPVIVDRLVRRGVQAGNFWGRQHPAVPEGVFPEVDLLRRTVVGLPCHQDLSPEIIDWMADQVCEVSQEMRK